MQFAFLAVAMYEWQGLNVINCRGHQEACTYADARHLVRAVRYIQFTKGENVADLYANLVHA
jgi:hypothetical protein